jgi:hypothetical protein
LCSTQANRDSRASLVTMARQQYLHARVLKVMMARRATMVCRGQKGR